MDLKSKSFSFLIITLVFLLESSSLFAASTKAQIHRFKFHAGMRQEKYQDYTYDEVNDASTSSKDVKLSTMQVGLGVVIKTVELEIDYRTTTPQSTPYWSKSNTMFINLSKYIERVPFIAPTIGIMNQNQTGNQAAEGAPAAFIKNNKAFVFGLHLSAIPFAFKFHGPIIQARYHYLTTGQSKRNFGTDRQMGLGYGYKGAKFQFGLLYQATYTFFNAAVPDKVVTDKLQRVRNETSGSAYMLYFEI